MFKIFFENNVYAYIEYLVFMTILTNLFFARRDFIASRYTYKNSFFKKLLILISTVIFCVTLYIVLASFSVHWSISVAVNALCSSLILVLIISLYFNKKSNN